MSVLAGEQQFRRTDLAWRYHADADALLHSRTETLAICQAFLLAAYAQLAAQPDFYSGTQRWSLGAIVICGAVLLTVAMLCTNGGLARGIEHLKRTELVGTAEAPVDPVYHGYLKAVRGNNIWKSSSGSHILATWIPWGFIISWLLIAIHLMYWVFTTHNAMPALGLKSVTPS